jgi:hypothetical protein
MWHRGAVFRAAYCASRSSKYFLYGLYHLRSRSGHDPAIEGVEIEPHVYEPDFPIVVIVENGKVLDVVCVVVGRVGYCVSIRVIVGLREA